MINPAIISMAMHLRTQTTKWVQRFLSIVREVIQTNSVEGGWEIATKVAARVVSSGRTVVAESESLERHGLDYRYHDRRI
jgi:hypothetical protein